MLLDAVSEAGAPQPEEVPPGAPFGDIEVSGVSFLHPVSSPEALWQGLLAGTVRSSMLVLGQPDPVQDRIRRAFDRLVERYRAGPGLELPVSVRVAFARKAGA